MAKKDKKKTENMMLPYVVSQKASKLDDETYDVYQKLINYLCKHENDDHRYHIMADHILSDLQEAQSKDRVAKVYVGNDYKAYLKKVEKNINFRQEIKRLRDNDYEKYTIASIWLVLMMFIALLFIRNWVIDEFIISFAIDGIVGAIALYFGIANFFTKYRVIKRYKFPDMFIYMDIMVFLLGLVIKFTTPAEYGNFDVTFLILVFSYLIPKKRIRKLFENAA